MGVRLQADMPKCVWAGSCYLPGIVFGNDTCRQAQGHTFQYSTTAAAVGLQLSSTTVQYKQPSPLTCEAASITALTGGICVTGPIACDVFSGAQECILTRVEQL